MDFSNFLFQWFGWYFLVLAFLFSIFHRKVQDALKVLSSNEAVLRLLGLMNIFFGIALAVGYLNFHLDKRVILQIIAILMIASGVFRFIFFKQAQYVMQLIIQKKYRPIILFVLYFFGFYLIS